MDNSWVPLSQVSGNVFELFLTFLILIAEAIGHTQNKQGLSEQLEGRKMVLLLTWRSGDIVEQ